MKKAHWLTLILSSLILAAPVSAEEKKPLLQDGKKTLYQRVLTYPGCQIADAVGKTGKEQPAFSRFYVYQRQKQGADEWLQVGPDSLGHVSGWMNANCTSEWKMQLTLAFTNPAGRNPMLFFKEKQTLEGLLDSPDPKKQYQPFLTDIKNQKVNPAILAKEPDYMIDQKSNFYL
ncbi:TPA: serine/threonine protein kinase, partial [Escherichia coli]|nr:serine/threonine protein kinase [Escherichia coli]